MLTFLGNSSIDIIDDNKIIGGSAIYSSISACLIKDINVNIITTLGKDFDTNKLLQYENLSIRHTVQSTELSNVFEIKENKIKLIGSNYLKINIPNAIKTHHLHVSCRKGVPVLDAIRKIKYEFLSFDVMKYSIESKWKEFVKLAEISNLFFCNKDEFEIISNKFKLLNLLFPHLIIIVTSHSSIKIIKNQITYKIEFSKSEKIISDTGAGDVFIGGVLSHLIKNKSLINAVLWGVVIAKQSITEYGANHLHTKKELLLKEFKNSKIDLDD